VLRVLLVVTLVDQVVLRQLRVVRVVHLQVLSLEHLVRLETVTVVDRLSLDRLVLGK
jgi:hypothetical protein